ncbi:hypothetical protein FACS189492_0720 [Clostridia bacterium]|nr:hypothetical protein FACS189492_0720 [Clostridia bacterium]
MFVKKREITALSENIRRIIDGQKVDLHDHSEGVFAILKNDIHTLADKLNSQATELAKEKQAMSEAITDISHQLKTPLTSAMMMSELLEKENKAEFHENLQSSLKRMEWLVYALLKLARLDSGTIEFKRENVNSDALIQMSIPDFVTREVNIAGESVGLNCDINWTVEALSNIIKNADEHAENAIAITQGENHLYTWIRVENDGAPISDLKRIFERFQTVGKKGGIGVGLNMAKTIMLRQGGNLEVELPNKFTLKFYCD